MIARRTISCLIALGLCTAGLAWIRASASTHRVAPDMLTADLPYAVDVAFDRARLDLKFDHNERYLLIIGSLGTGHQPRTVTLTSQPITKTTPLSARPLTPLRHRHPPQQSQQVTVEPHKRKPPKVINGHTLRYFDLHVADGSLDDPHHYVRVAAKLVGEGNEVRVYLDQQQTEKELSAGLVDSIVQRIDNKLLPRFRQQVGGYRDVDGDGKFTVLLSPWLGKLQGGKTSLGGFVRESDFRTDIEAPFSNRCDMMYLNSNLSPGPHLQTLLAHEFMHAVSFSARLPSPQHPSGLPDEEDWLNESIAHLSENLNGNGWSNLDYRISRFLAKPQQFPLVVDDYYHAGLWRNHGCRGATYLFLRWCVDEFGTGILKKLVHAPASGRENLEHATGIPFAELFRRWTIALYQSNRYTKANARDDATQLSTDHTASQFGRYHSIDLRGSIGEWGLAGPRPLEWTVSDRALEVSLTGTSSAFVLLNPPSASGKQKIHLSAPFGTKLQVTLIKLPKNLPAIRHTANWQRQPSTKSAKGKLHLKLKAPNLAAMEVEHVSFCRNEGETKQTIYFAGQALQECRVPNGEGSSPNSFAFPLSATAGNWLATIAAHDKQGRRVSSFIDVPGVKKRTTTRLAAGQRPARTSANR